MRALALSLSFLIVACGGQVDTASSSDDASTDAATETAPATDAPTTTPGCCELGAPACGCTVVGTLPDGTCSTICDAKPVGWTRAIDARGCPQWNVPAGSCLGASCPGTATFCGAGCSAVQGQQFNAVRSCVNPTMTAGCMVPTGACTGAITCKVRIADGAVFRFNAGCPLDGWRPCTDADYTKVLSAPACEGIDAG